MPTEHEYKYVLALDTDEEYFRENCKNHFAIRQGYLASSKGMTCRVRSLRDGSSVKWFLTFKQKVDNRVIEIEQRLDDRDGKDLWSVTKCVSRLKKERYVLEHDGIDWEVDFFRAGSDRYFVLAEVELTEGSPRIALPKFIHKFLLHEVDLTDDRFGNKKLADVEHASNMYKQIVQGGTGNES